MVADIPGLIEGAHQGHGLGHEFLRHVERTRLLVHLVEAVPIDGSDPLANYQTIRHELELYSPKLAERPEIVVVTKLDLTGADEAFERIKRSLEPDRAVLAISAVTGKGVPVLLHRIAERLETAEATPPEASADPGAAVGPLASIGSGTPSTTSDV